MSQGIPFNTLLASINESLKIAHVASKTTFLRFSQSGGYFFDKDTEIDIFSTVVRRSEKISQYKKKG